jgi:hypothetical protein
VDTGKIWNIPYFGVEDSSRRMADSGWSIWGWIWENKTLKHRVGLHVLPMHSAYQSQVVKPEKFYTFGPSILANAIARLHIVGFGRVISLPTSKYG